MTSAQVGKRDFEDHSKSSGRMPKTSEQTLCRATKPIALPSQPSGPDGCRPHPVAAKNFYDQPPLQLFPQIPDHASSKNPQTPETPLAAIDKDMSDWMVSTPSSSNSFESLHGFCPKIWSQTKSTFWKHWNYFYYSLLRVIPALTKILCYLSAMVLTRILTLFLAHLSGREEEERKILIKFRDLRARGQPEDFIRVVLSSASSSSFLLRSGSARWDLELAVEFRQCTLKSGARSSIWHIFWHSFWHCIWIYLAYLLTFFLAFYLAYLLTVFLTFFLAYLLTVFWYSIWHIFWQSFWHLPYGVL